MHRDKAHKKSDNGLEQGNDRRDADRNGVQSLL